MTMLARFDGVCRTCGMSYRAGQAIRNIGGSYKGLRKWVHDVCPQSSPAAPSNGHSDPVAEFVPPPAAVSVVDADMVRKLVLDALTGATVKVDEAQVLAAVMTNVESLVAKVKAEMVAQGAVKTELHVRINNGEPVKVEGRTHAAFADVLKLAVARKSILLVGPAGCGKTHLCEQLAQALGLSFSHISCSAGMSEGQLTGKLLPVGKRARFLYIISEFVKAYEHGGVFLLDEIDAADSNTMLVINSALANGKMAVPNRPRRPVAVRHPDFVCVAAANTFGTGADRQYVGRNQLDESTLDRFRIGQVEMDYDLEVEAALCPDESLRSHLQGYRERIRAAKVLRIVSSRFMRDAYDMKQAGWSNERIDKALFAGWRADERAKVAVA